MRRLLSSLHYEKALDQTDLDFIIPKSPAHLNVVECVEGNIITDIGVHDVHIPCDKQPIDALERNRFQSILKASWLACEQAVQNALGKNIRKGPRNGGRDLKAII